MSTVIPPAVPPARVELRSDEFDLVGHLRLPPTAGPAPGVVLTGPLSGVKDQVVGVYAERLTARGYATLAFDHRRFGESSGLPRQHEDAAGRLADLRDATSWLSAHDGVDPDRIAVVGVCLGTAYALTFAAFDPRVAAVGLVAGAYNSPAAMRAAMGPEGYRAQLRRAADAAAAEVTTGEVAYLPAVTDGDGPAFMPGTEPFAYYGTERGRRPGWVNQLTVRSLASLLTLDADGAATYVSPTPLVMVHGRTDAYCSPEAALATFERVGEPKRLVWLDAGEHIDFYDVAAFVDPAVAAVADWFDDHLPARAPAPAPTAP